MVILKLFGVRNPFEKLMKAMNSYSENMHLCTTSKISSSYNLYANPMLRTPGLISLGQILCYDPGMQ